MTGVWGVTYQRPRSWGFYSRVSTDVNMESQIVNLGPNHSRAFHPLVFFIPGQPPATFLYVPLDIDPLCFCVSGMADKQSCCIQDRAAVTENAGKLVIATRATVVRHV